MVGFWHDNQQRVCLFSNKAVFGCAQEILPCHFQVCANKCLQLSSQSGGICCRHQPCEGLSKQHSFKLHSALSQPSRDRTESNPGLSKQNNVRRPPYPLRNDSFTLLDLFLHSLRYKCWCMTLTWDPPLKAKKQTRRIPPPSAAKGTECPGISLTDPSALNLPFRGPMIMQPT